MRRIRQLVFEAGDSIGGWQWDCLGSKARFHPELSVVSSFPNHCLRGSSMPYLCVDTCECVSAEPGSPIARTSFCSSSRTGIRSPIFRRATSHRVPYGFPTVARPAAHRHALPEQQQLSRTDFVYGQFGENFTVEDLTDDIVCIGDRYRAGSALCEATQPRVICYRVGSRIKVPRMLALLTSSGRPGFYFRAL